jgi:hypothetical protein
MLQQPAFFSFIIYIFFYKKNISNFFFSPRKNNGYKIADAKHIKKNKNT